KILIAPLRPAALLAKTVATLDALSRGRIELGVATGWQREEYDAQGLDWARRGALPTQTHAARPALWTRAPARFRSRAPRPEGAAPRGRGLCAAPGAGAGPGLVRRAAARAQPRADLPPRRRLDPRAVFAAPDARGGRAGPARGVGARRARPGRPRSAGRPRRG